MLGADACALFPSLDATKCVRIVNDEFVASDLTVEGADYLELGKYVSLNWPPGKIKLRGLARVCPIRKYKFGPKAGLTSKEAKEKSTDNDEKSKWEYRTLEQTPSEQRLLIGAALEIAIEASFKLHLYSFKGRVYRQLRGGPIGSRLTMCVARVVMKSWGKLF